MNTNYACSYVSRTKGACSLPRIISIDIGVRTLAIAAVVVHPSEKGKEKEKLQNDWGDFEIVGIEQMDILRDHLLEFDGTEVWNNASDLDHFGLQKKREHSGFNEPRMSLVFQGQVLYVKV